MRRRTRLGREYRELGNRGRTSSFCSGGGCVGVTDTPHGGFAVIDTKDAASPILRFTRGEWAEFVAGVKNGEFDVAD